MKAKSSAPARSARAPLAEDDQGDGDPAAAGDDAEGEGVELGDGQIGAADRHQRAAEDQRLVAHRRDADAGGIGGARVLADGAQIEAPGRAVRSKAATGTAAKAR